MRKSEKYMTLGLSDKLTITYMTVCPTYNLPKIKTKSRLRSTYLKKLNSEARLWNGKVFGTHSA